MEFAVDCFVLVVYQLKRMRAIAVHVTVSVRNATIAKEEHNLMRCLSSKRDEVPKHVSILEVLLTLTLTIISIHGLTFVC